MLRLEVPIQEAVEVEVEMVLTHQAVLALSSSDTQAHLLMLQA
jgi:hypothetical protein